MEEEIFKQLQKLLLFKTHSRNIKLSSSLKNDLKMDEFDFAVLRQILCKKFQILFAKEECLAWTTVQDIVNALAKKIS